LATLKLEDGVAQTAPVALPPQNRHPPLPEVHRPVEPELVLLLWPVLADAVPVAPISTSAADRERALATSLLENIGTLREKTYYLD